MRGTRSVLIAILALGIVACSRKSQPAPSPEPESYSAVEGSLGFDISPDPQSEGHFVASYTSQSKLAQFRIELDPIHISEKANFGVGKGRFVSEPGSQSGPFLSDLAKVLEAKHIPKTSLRSATLPFEYVVLGENQSRSKEGSFSDSPTGSWTLLKLFFGDDQAEVYLNVNRSLKKAEFSIKDTDYGDYLIAEFSKVL